MTISKNEIRISVKVNPGAPHNEVVGLTNDTLRVKVAAQPAKGKANKELVDFLSRILDIEKSRINIVRGKTSQHKIISVHGLSQEEIIKRLTSAIKKAAKNPK